MRPIIAIIGFISVTCLGISSYSSQVEAEEILHNEQIIESANSKAGFVNRDFELKQNSQSFPIVLENISVVFLDQNNNVVDGVIPPGVILGKISLRPGNQYENLEALEQALRIDYNRILSLGISKEAGLHFWPSRLEKPETNSVEVVIYIIDEALNEWNQISQLAFNALQAGDKDSKREYYEEIIAVSRAQGDLRTTTLTLVNLGNSYAEEERYEEALKYYNEIREIVNKNPRIYSGIEQELLVIFILIKEIQAYSNLGLVELSIDSNQSIIEHLNYVGRLLTDPRYINDNDFPIHTIDLRKERDLSVFQGIVSIGNILMSINLASTYSYLGNHQQSIYFLNNSNIAETSRTLEQSWQFLANQLLENSSLREFSKQEEFWQLAEPLTRLMSNAPAFFEQLTLTFAYSDLNRPTKREESREKANQILDESFQNFFQAVGNNENIQEIKPFVDLLEDLSNLFLAERKSTDEVSASIASLRLNLLQTVELFLGKEVDKDFEQYIDATIALLLPLSTSSSSDADKKLLLYDEGIALIDQLDPTVITFTDDPNTNNEIQDRLENLIALSRTYLLYSKGKVYVDSGQYSEGMEFYDSAISFLKEDEQLVEAFEQSAGSLDLLTDKISVPLDGFQDILQLPLESITLDDPNLLEDLLENQMGSFAEALEGDKNTYTSLIDFFLITFENSVKTNLLISLGDAHYLSGNQKEAIDSYYRAITLGLLQKGESVSQSDPFLAKAGLIFYKMGRSHYVENDVDEALNFFEKAAQLIDSYRPSKKPFELSSLLNANFDYGYGFRNASGFSVGVDLNFSQFGFSFESLSNVLLSDLGCINERAYDSCRRLIYDQYISALIEQSTLYESEKNLIRAFEASEQYHFGQLFKLSQVSSETPINFSNFMEIQQPERILQIDFAEIREELLDADTVLLEYFLGETQSHLWVVSQERGLQYYSLPARAKIEQSAEDYYAMLVDPKSQGRPQKTAEAGKILAQDILQEAYPDLKGKRLLIVADGILNHVPFNAIPEPTDSTIVDLKLPPQRLGRFMSPLLMHFEIVNAPSASLLLEIRERKRYRSEAEKTLGIFANPIFHHKDKRLNFNFEGRSHRESIYWRNDSADTQAIETFFSTLPGTEAEAETISALLTDEKVDVFQGLDASIQTLMADDLDAYQVLHFATHSIFNDFTDLRSGVVLSAFSDAGRLQRNLLSPRDMQAMNLAATEMVVLSSCRTALPGGSSQSAISEMVKSLITVGADQVAASLWSVSDRATLKVMDNFYRHLLAPSQPLTPAEALRQTQQSMWFDPNWESPYLWAGFTLYGDWQDISR